MERLRFTTTIKTRTILVITGLFLFFPMMTKAGKYVDIVHDKKAIEAYSENVSYVNITENYHNALINRTRKKKEKLAEYHATMESIKELYRMSMQNVRGFGSESVYYRQIAEEFGKIPRNMAKAVKAVGDSPLFNYVNSIDELASLQAYSISIVEKFIDIVNNGKVDLSAFTSGKNDKLTQWLRNAHAGKGDGYNMLDRNQRVGLVMNLLYNLQNINYRLENIIYISECSNKLSRMLYKLDPGSWCRIMGGYMSADYVINEWNRQMHTF